MPNFWDTLKSVGAQAASTAGQVYQSTLGTFSGVANSKINQVANGVQSQVGNIVKPRSAEPSNASPLPAPPATPVKQAASLGIAALAVAAVVVFLLLRKK